MTFENLDLIEPINKALEREGYTTPTPIQSEAIPIILQGYDLLGCAQTGTGKTAAFSIPIIQQLYLRKESHRYGIKALVLTPTRELAIQIGESFASYGYFAGLSHTVIFGGVKQKPQTDALRKGVDILIATPGRLLDLVGQGFIELDTLEYFVLDEADLMLDMGFSQEIDLILPLLPEKRQTLFFSATMPADIEYLAGTILNEPRKVEANPPSSTVDMIKQSIYFVEKDEKINLLESLLKNPELESVLIFTRTRRVADKVANLLSRANIRAEAIHGYKSQFARQRALTNFKKHKTRVLIATDIAARGIDVNRLTHVINYELPYVPEIYVHRIGRTGRAGHEGVALSFCSADEVSILGSIQRLLGKEVNVVSDHMYDSEEVRAASARYNKVTGQESIGYDMFDSEDDSSYWYDEECTATFL
ncbi:DEAD/DEAH box helicase [uncultured Parabacteroides sp.]|uniref:DEAD/DEAH box helicase n=1 Tax=uncultured Parabacteroides sp. TaxID=512312 RepID=UPI002602CFEF|nr:DEAD/DEAH box helicase [uncultured Parabacteroides sp.]